MSDESKKLSIDVIINKVGNGGQLSAEELAALKKATEKAGDATKEHEKKILGLNTEMGEQRRIIQSLRTDIPGLTEALNLMTDPLTVLIGLGLEGFNLWRDHIAEVNKKLDELGEKLAEPTFLEGIEARTAAFREMRQAQIDFNTELQNSVTWQEAFNQKLKEEDAIRAARAAADNARASAAQKAADAQIDADQAAGRITPAQAAAKKAVNATTAEQDAENRKEADFAEKQAADQKAAEEARQKGIEAYNAEVAAAAAHAQEEAKIKQAKADHDALLARQPDLEKAVKDKAAALPDWMQDSSKLEVDSRHGDARNTYLAKFRKNFSANDANALDEYAAALNASDQNFAATKKAKETSELPDTTSAALKQAQETTKAAIKVFEDLKKAIETAAGVEAERVRGAQSALGSDASASLNKLITGNRGTNVGGGALGPDVTMGFLDDVMRVQAKGGQNLTADDKNIAAAYASLLNNQLNHNSELYRFITNLMSHIGNSTAMIQDFQRQLDYQAKVIAQLKNQNGSSTYRPISQ